MRIAVVGAGVAGLGAALACARTGHDVVLLERDATPLPHTPDEAFDWKRRGAPQVRHSHALLARLRNLLRDRFPEVREGLLAAGATEAGWAQLTPGTTPEPGDDDLTMFACRRTTFEWVLRRVVQDTIDLRDGVIVEGLIEDGSRVTGVRTSHGDIGADFVLDATGRPSHTLGLGIEETKSETGIVYLSRFYRLRDGADEPTAEAFAGADLEYVKIGVFRGDNRTFSITLAHTTDDDTMRVLREETAFEAALRVLPMCEPWTHVSDPISDVHYMGGLINRVRHLVRDGEPVALGFAGVGDASVCTNPMYGRGCSLGVYQGVLFADALAEHGDDLRSVALGYNDATARELVPWYVAAVGQDKVSMQLQRGEKLSEFDEYVRSIVRDGVFPAARVDPGVGRAWFRTFNLLTAPDGLMSDEKVMAKVLEVWNERESREPETTPGPQRAAFLDAITGRS